MLGVAYLYLAFGEVAAGIAARYLALFLATAIATAAIGHLVNDWSDLSADARAGRPSPLKGLTSSRRLGLGLSALIAAVAPWIALPRSALNLSLFGLELALFAAYSLPPLRFKERGWAGPLTDALYGHAVPTAIALTTFALLLRENSQRTQLLAFALVAWKLVQGLASALESQARDRKADRRSGALTLALAVGPLAAHRVANRLFPVHAVAFLAALSLTGELAPWFLGLFLAHTAWTAWRLHRREGKRASFYLRDVPAYPYLHDFQERWFPLVPLAALVAAQPAWLAIALVHLLLFRTALDPLLPWRRRKR